MDMTKHTQDVVGFHERILAESSAEGRFIELESGGRLHVIEAGEGPPVVILHGTGAAAHTFLPVFEHLEGVRAIAPDRPGFGLSDGVEIDPANYREAAVHIPEDILQALGVERVPLVGSSGGATWEIWYALAHPERVERLVLMGSAPLLPGTKPSLPVRLITTPLIGDIMARLPADENMVRQLMAAMGEAETIGDHPDIIQGLVASNNDPLTAETNREEFSALLNLFGFRPELHLQADELAQLSMPVLVIWGTHDPLGGGSVRQGSVPGHSRL